MRSKECLPPCSTFRGEWEKLGEETGGMTRTWLAHPPYYFPQSPSASAAPRSSEKDAPSAPTSSGGEEWSPLLSPSPPTTASVPQGTRATRPPSHVERAHMSPWQGDRAGAASPVCSVRGLQRRAATVRRALRNIKALGTRHVIIPVRLKIRQICTETQENPCQTLWTSRSISYAPKGRSQLALCLGFSVRERPKSEEKPARPNNTGLRVYQPIKAPLNILKRRWYPLGRPRSLYGIF